MHYPPMPSDFHNRNPPLPFTFPIFLSNPLELPAGFANMPNLAYFKENYILLLFRTAGYRESHHDSGNSGMKIKKKINSFLLIVREPVGLVGII